jgi:hypothetical protein
MLLNGDASQWDRALQMPHYNARAMPAISFHTGVHLVQWARSGRFTLYDYGSAALNKCVWFGVETLERAVIPHHARPLVMYNIHVRPMMP